MRRRAIPRAEWPAFLPSFADRHAGWLVRLQAKAVAGTPSRADDYTPLRELRLDERGSEIIVAVGEPDEPNELHLADPHAVHVELAGDGVECGLSIEARDTELTLHFRTAIAPELVDGPLV